MRTGRKATPRKRWGTPRKQRTQKREAFFLQLWRRVHVPREEGGPGMRRFRGQEEDESSECLGGGRHVVPVLVPTDFGSRRQAGLWGDSGAAQPNQRDAVREGGGRNRRARDAGEEGGPGAG
ncbi:hypothetical protein ERJ75_000125800 [Trypanosoma vivax]|nr:hypothetical protein ERJ75_000125800 [Trypanosoma vivax]